MALHIQAFARLTGVSVRTLHYYDQIGLLKPAVDRQNGYRLYDEACLARMQEILFYRELDFPLKEICAILSSPDHDRQAALQAQRRLLTLKKARLERLIAALDGAMKGDPIEMSTFDNSEFEARRQEYAKEAKEKWGGTAAWQEYEQKNADGKWEQLSRGMDALMAEFARCKAAGQTPGSPAAQELVKQWQDFISANCYTCTKEILAGLGQMYVADQRFTANMDRHGEGTAQFMADAIAIYCR